MRYLLVLLVLAACATPEERRARTEAQTDLAFRQCADAGYTPGSDAHFQCVRRTVMSQQPAPVNTPQTTDCKPDGYGGMRCTTR